MNLVKRFFCVGKFVDLESREIFSTDFAVAKVVVSWLGLGVSRYRVCSLHSFLGSLQWALQPR